MSDIYEFEPGATPNFFVRMREAESSAGFLDLSDADFMFSVSIDDACVPLTGEYDVERNGFTVDLNELADLVRPRSTYKGYFYMRRGSARWVRIGEMRIKPIVGCIWNPQEVA